MKVKVIVSMAATIDRIIRSGVSTEVQYHFQHCRCILLFFSTKSFTWSYRLRTEISGLSYFDRQTARDAVRQFGHKTCALKIGRLLPEVPVTPICLCNLFLNNISLPFDVQVGRQLRQPLPVSYLYCFLVSTF